MTFLEFLKKYPVIELFSRGMSYELYKQIREFDASKSPLAYLIALGIPVSSALTIAGKLATDACRALDTIIQSIQHREYAGGNVQTLVVDGAEYVRSGCGLLTGALLALYSPRVAAETFLTIAADPSKAFLTADEGARLYAMGDRLHAFFVRHAIDYRICSGTALGAIREKGIILNDDDIDLMIHPDYVLKLKTLIENGSLTQETGISIEPQIVTGGWQCFYADSPKGEPGTPTEKIGKPFIDIFPGTWRVLGSHPIITFGVDTMYLQSKGDHFTQEEWGKPCLYPFGPTQLYGVRESALRQYLSRCYGPSALFYKTRLYPHEVYSGIYAHPLSAFSVLSRYPAPRYMRNVSPSPLGFDQAVYAEKRALASPELGLSLTSPRAEKRIWVDGIFDLFHEGHQNIINNAIGFTQEKYPDHDVFLLIGICGDGDDVQAYKRKPIMTLEERCAAVTAFMAQNHPDVAFRIVPNSPVTHTLDFIREHELQIIFHGSDFTPEKIEQYYGVILKECQGSCSIEILPYTRGVSTTELIGRLLADGDLGDSVNSTGLSVETLAQRVADRAEEFRPKHSAAAVF